MNTNPGKLLSACLMVKDEERNIKRCLQSIKGIVDEIVIVDTGSNDRTKEIAASFGARIFDHPWEDNFSLHRNQSIDHAEGEWVLIIDADEELVFPFKEFGTDHLHDFLSKMPAYSEAAGIQIADMQGGRKVMEFNSSRIFRRGKVRYQGIVHNAPQVSTSEAYLYDKAFIRHYGYDLNPEEKTKKYERTKSLLMKRMEIKPNDYDAMFYLCQLNAEGGRNREEAVEWGMKYISNREAILKTSPNNFNQSIYYTTVRLLLYFRRGEEAKSILSEGIKYVKEDIDLAMAVVEYGEFMNDNAIKLEGVKAFLDLYRKYSNDPFLKANRFIYTHRPEALCYALYHQSLALFIEGVKAFGTLREALNEQPEPLKTGFLKDFQTALYEAGVPLEIEYEAKGSNGEDKAAAMQNVVTANFNREEKTL